MLARIITNGEKSLRCEEWTGKTLNWLFLWFVLIKRTLNQEITQYKGDPTVDLNQVIIFIHLPSGVTGQSFPGSDGVWGKGCVLWPVLSSNPSVVCHVGVPVNYDTTG